MKQDGRYPCGKCTRLTPWDVRVSAAPLCVVCWDSVSNADMIDADNQRYIHGERV